MEGLGFQYDIALGSAAADATAGAITGSRVHLKNAEGVAFLVTYSGASTDVPSLSLQQHTAASGGTSANLSAIDNYYYKAATTIDGTQTWTGATQAASYQITSVGAASQQVMVVVEVDATSLSAGYEWVSCNVAKLGSNGTHYTTIHYILRRLLVQRDPTKLVTPNS